MVCDDRTHDYLKTLARRMRRSRGGSGLGNTGACRRSASTMVRDSRFVAAPRASDRRPASRRVDDGMVKRRILFLNTAVLDASRPANKTLSGWTTSVKSNRDGCIARMAPRGTTLGSTCEENLTSSGPLTAHRNSGFHWAVSHRPLSRHAIPLLLLAATGCKPIAQKSDAAPQGMLADIGFRPNKDGFKFENQGGHFPRTPPVLTNTDVVQMFGANACVKGTAANCKLNPVASEWMQMVNREMNDGQCEGMAVSSLAFFKGVHKPTSFAPHAKSVHDLTHSEVGPLIGYYWAYQMTNPVHSDKVKSLLTNTPISVEAELVDMLKRKELAVIAIRSKHGGHAVSPYAVEDKGGGIHWIHIYDNNWPDKERHIIIDHNEDTWAYELASLNPDIPREPWRGDADTHSIAVTSLQDRLSKPECPFCTGSAKKAIVPGESNGVLVTNGEGKRVGRDGDNVVNEIPGAEVIEPAAYIPGEAPPEPIILVPSEGDYQVNISGHGRTTPAKADPDAHHGVTIIGNGAAVTVQTKKMEPADHDTLSLPHDGGIKYKSGQTGEFPTIHLAANGPNGGMQARLSGMQAAANDEIALKLDHVQGQVMVSGGSKVAKSFDLKVTHVASEGDDKVVEQKGIKYDPTKLHTIQSNGTGPALPLVMRTALPPPPTPSASASASAPPGAAKLQLPPPSPSASAPIKALPGAVKVQPPPPPAPAHKPTTLGPAPKKP